MFSRRFHLLASLSLCFCAVAEIPRAVADTTVPGFSVLSLTRNTLPSDPGPITVQNRGTLELNDSAGGFVLSNNVVLGGAGYPIILGLKSRSAIEAVLTQGSTITLSGNISALSSTGIGVTGPLDPFQTTPPNGGTLLLTGKITASGTSPISIGLGSNVIFSGTISDGPSAIVSMNFSGQTLTGVNTYSGGTNGTVRISSDASLGASTGQIGVSSSSSTIQLAASIVSARPMFGSVTLAADAGTASTFTGRFDNISVTGAGTVTVSGPMYGSSISVNGPGTAVIAGTFAGSLASINPVPQFFVYGGTAVLANASLFAGQEAIVDVRGGTLRTDGSFHSLTVSEYREVGGTLQLRQLSATASERIVVVPDPQGNDGIAELDGGVVQILPVAGYQPHTGDQFVILTSRALEGQFSQLIGPPGFLTRTTYVSTFTNPGSSSVTVQEFALSDLVTSRNGASVARALMRGAQAGLSGNLFSSSGLFFSRAADDTQLAHDLDQLTPQRFQVFRNIAFDQADFVASALDQWRARGAARLSGFDTAFNGAWGGFVSATGATATIHPAQGVPTADYDSAGMVAGIERAIGDSFSVGAILAYQATDAHLDQQGSRATVHSVTPGLFAGYTVGGFSLRGLGSYSFDRYHTDRRVQIGTAFDETAQGATSGDKEHASLSVGYDFAWDAFRVGPLVEGAYSNLAIHGYVERSADAANLFVGKQRSDSFRTRVGLHVAVAGPVHADLAVGLQHELLAGPTQIESDFTQSGTGGFTTTLPSLKGPSKFARFGLGGAVADRISLVVNYQVETNHRETAHDFIGGAKITF